MCGSKMRTATDWCSARRCLERHQDVRGPGKFFYKSTTGQSRLTILLFYPPKQWLFKGEEARRYIHVVKVTRQMHTKTFFFGRVQMRPDNEWQMAILLDEDRVSASSASQHGQPMSRCYIIGPKERASSGGLSQGGGRRGGGWPVTTDLSSWSDEVIRVIGVVFCRKGRGTAMPSKEQRGEQLRGISRRRNSRRMSAGHPLEYLQGRAEMPSKVRCVQRVGQQPQQQQVESAKLKSNGVVKTFKCQTSQRLGQLERCCKQMFIE